jgi:3-phenylpropionate/trans-cinnamate dioxygenase ferredoxin subunit
MGTFVKVAEQDEIAGNTGKLIEVRGRQIALLREGDTYYALDNTCTHRGGPLAEGTIEQGEVVCPWHGAHFDLGTGQPTCPPASVEVNTYPVRLKGQDIEIEL